MGKVKNKIYDWKDRLRSGKMLTLVATLIIIIIILGVYAYKKDEEYKVLSENNYNNAFYQLVEYVNGTEKMLAKSIISYSDKHGAQTLTSVWQDASMAQICLSRLPIETQELENTQKFLNQVSDFSLAIAKKSIAGEMLSDENLEDLSKLHEYSVSLENTLNQLETDIYSGSIKWGELTSKGSNAFSNESNNLSQSSFKNIEEDLHEYSGLIYDGAYSEHITTAEKYGLSGDDVDEEMAKNKAKEYIGNDKIQEINSKGESTNANIESFIFDVKSKNNSNFLLSISKKGGHLVFLNCDRDVKEQTISDDEAIKNGKEYLDKKGFSSMKETYYMKTNNILTVNYAYNENDIVMYPDLIKVKIALDNGEILGVESNGYLNSHRENRDLKEIKIEKEEALKLINPKLEVKSIGMAVIPTEWKTEILCWEIKGSSFGNDFIVYINSNTGEEEDILMIINTPNGTLTT